MRRYITLLTSSGRCIGSLRFPYFLIISHLSKLANKEVIVFKHSQPWMDSIFQLYYSFMISIHKSVKKSWLSYSSHFHNRLSNIDLNSNKLRKLRQIFYRPCVPFRERTTSQFPHVWPKLRLMNGDLRLHSKFSLFVVGGD